MEEELVREDINYLAVPVQTVVDGGQSGWCWRQDGHMGCC